MNWDSIIIQLIYCLHCSVVFAVHSKHFRNNNNINNQKEDNNNNNKDYNNENFDNNFWYNQESYENQGQLKHRIHEHDIWNNYQSYQPSIDERLAMDSIDTSTERPPYYLSYDSGIKTKFQAIEDKWLEQKLKEQHRNDQDYESNVRTKLDRIESPSQKISHDKYQIQIESQIKDQQQEVIDEEEQNRKVGAKGLGGTFGFMVGQHFFPCDKPAFIENDPQTGNYLIPKSIGYYRKCRYYDDDPRRPFQRKVGALGVNGYYGYFENSRFVECAPPKRLEQDTQDRDVYYIPNDIDYEPKCKYFGYNVSKRFDASSDYRNSFGQTSIKTIENYWVLLPLYLLILILSYF